MRCPPEKLDLFGGLLTFNGIGVLPDELSTILSRAVPIGLGNTSAPF